MDISNPDILTTTESVAGIVNPNIGTHFFRIEVTAGKLYQLNLAGTGSLLSAIYDSEDQKITDINQTNGSFIASETTSYLIEVAAEGEIVGDYEISIEEAATLDTNTPITASIDSKSDIDLFKIDVIQGTRYDIKLAGEGSILSALYDENGTKIDDLGIPEWSGNSPVTGTYYLEVTAANEYVDVIEYKISITEPEDDYHADNETQGLLGSTAVDGVIGSLADKDWFKVNLTEGASYNISLSDASLAKFSAAYDIDGKTIALTGKQLEFDSTVTGTYYIEVSADEQQAGDYSITMTEDLNLVGLDYHQANRTNAADLNTDSAQSGAIDTKGGQDWFKIIVEPGKTYSITLTSTSDAIDPIINGIYDANGNFMPGSTNDDGADGFNAQLIATFDANEYFLAVAAVREDIGAYQLAIEETTEPNQLDIQADSSRQKVILDDAEPLATGETKDGEISAIGETDQFEVELLAETEYKITLTGTTLADPYLSGIYDGKGTVIEHTIDNDSGTGNNAQLTFTPTESALYYIEASSWNALKTGSYTISFTESGDDNPEDDYLASTATTGEVVVGEGAANGIIENVEDNDWFKVSLIAETSYKITQSSGSPAQIEGIYDSNGDAITATRGNSEFTSNAAGDYYISVGPRNLFGILLIGDYSLSIDTETSTAQNPPPDDEPTTNDDPVIIDDPGDGIDSYSANTNTTGNISVGTPIRSAIETSGDQDWFRVQLDKNVKYQVDLEGSASSKGSLRDPFFKGFYDSNGDLIAGTENDDTANSLNSQSILTITESGTYYIAAGASGSIGTYQISITEWQDSAVPGDDFLQSTATSGSITVGEAQEAEIDYLYDEDWFEVTLEAGTIYNIDLMGDYNNDIYTLVDPVLNGIYGEDGLLISANTIDDNSGLGFSSHIEFTPETTATYYIAATTEIAQTGTYRLSVSTDDYSADTDTDGRITVGGKKQGVVETPGDTDWFRVSLDSDASYRANLTGNTNNNAWIDDPVIKGVYNSSGNLLSNTFNDDGGSGLNARVDFSVPSDGEYYIAAETRNGLTGIYELQLIEL